MPNWCENRVVFKTEEEKNAFLEYAQGDPEYFLDFDKIAPMPEGLTDEEQREWVDKNWETTWECGEGWDCGEGILYFETAWCAPVPIFERIAQALPDVRFAVLYNEFGAVFCGTIIAKGDGTIEHNYIDLEVLRSRL